MLESGMKIQKKKQTNEIENCEREENFAISNNIEEVNLFETCKYRRNYFSNS